jgi:hypothetical protein
LFKPFEIAQPSIEGRSCGHILKKVCLFRECQEYALHCEDDCCEESYAKHFLCKSVTLKGVTSLLGRHFAANREFVGKMFEVEDALVRELASRREEIVSRMSFKSLEEKHQKIID